jgi:TolB-like protein
MGIHTFDEYVLDEDRRELRRGVDAVSVEPQVFDVLLHLVRNRHRVVSNDDLLASVWRGRIVSQSTLSSRIAAVRRAVGDSGEHQRLIRTVQRNGYRFVGSVSTAPVQPDKGRPPQESEAGEATGIGGIATTQRLQSRPSIAILPFADRSADPVLDSLVEGVFEDVTTALSRFSWLAVTSGSSGVSCRDRWLDVREAGRELDVRYVLEGSARRTSTGVRTTARLIDAATGVHLWSNHFDLPCRGALGGARRRDSENHRRG